MLFSMPGPHIPAALQRVCASAPVLGVDYGRRRIGLAISDEMGMTVRPLGTLTRTNRQNDLRRLRELVRKHGVRRIVVGHPLNLDGTASEMTAEAERFAARVEKHLGLPVELMDERLSSWEAEQMLATRAKKNSRKRARTVDETAAAVILRDFLTCEQARAQVKG